MKRRNYFSDINLSSLGRIILGEKIHVPDDYVATDAASPEINRRWRRLNNVSLILIAILCALTLLAITSIERNRDAAIYNETKSESDWLRKHVSNALISHNRAIERMARRWEANGGTPRKVWQQDVGEYIHDLNGLQVIEWADNRGRIRWVAPIKGNRKAMDLDLNAEAARAAVLRKSRRLKRLVFSGPINLVQGGKGFLLVRPLKVRGRFDGYIVAVFRMQKYFQILTEDVCARGYNFTASTGGKIIYNHSEESSIDDSNSVPVHRSTINSGARDWELKLWPSSQYLAKRTSSFIGIIFFAGVSTLFISVSFRLWLFSLLRAKILQEANFALKESEGRWQFAIEGTGDGLWDCDVSKKTVFYSKRWKAMLGYDEQDIGPTLRSWRNLVHPDDRAGVLANIKEHFRGKSDVYENEHRILCKDGTYKWILARGKVTEWDEDGNPRRMIGTYIDEAERKKLEFTLLTAREEAEQANLAKSQFLSKMSHELRTPLNAIMGFSQLLELEASLSFEQRSNVKEILVASRHLLELINEVLDLARIESGSMVIIRELFNGELLIDECMTIIRAQAEKKNISVSQSGFSDLELKTDRLRLKQVIINLLSNALKYNYEGGKIFVQAARTGSNALEIKVIDTGIGIPPDQFQELFKPFHRLGVDNSVVEGTGIGLALSKNLLELMGGKLTVESELEKGSTFTIELPLHSIE